MLLRERRWKGIKKKDEEEQEEKALEEVNKKDFRGDEGVKKRWKMMESLKWRRSRDEEEEGKGEVREKTMKWEEGGGGRGRVAIEKEVINKRLKESKDTKEIKTKND